MKISEGEIAQQIAHDLVWWVLTPVSNSSQISSTATLSKYMQQSSDNWQNFLALVFHSHLVSQNIKLWKHTHSTETQLNIQLMHWTQCAHAASLHPGMICDWMTHTALPLVCNKGKIADNSIQLNTSHALQPHYQNETFHSSVSTKDELKQPIACEVNAQALSAEQVKIHKRSLPLQKHQSPRGTGLLWREIYLSCFEKPSLLSSYFSRMVRHYQVIALKKIRMYSAGVFCKNSAY